MRYLVLEAHPELVRDVIGAEVLLKFRLKGSGELVMPMSSSRRNSAFAGQTVAGNGAW